MSARNQCRYLDRYSGQCTGEAVDPEGEVLLCTRHLGRALELLQRRGAVPALATTSKGK